VELGTHYYCGLANSQSLNATLHSTRHTASQAGGTHVAVDCRVQRTSVEYDTPQRPPQPARTPHSAGWWLEYAGTSHKEAWQCVAHECSSSSSNSNNQKDAKGQDAGRRMTPQDAGRRTQLLWHTPGTTQQGAQGGSAARTGTRTRAPRSRGTRQARGSPSPAHRTAPHSPAQRTAPASHTGGAAVAAVAAVAAGGSVRQRARPGSSERQSRRAVCVYVLRRAACLRAASCSHIIQHSSHTFCCESFVKYQKH
jgi:hypothetical protein